MKISALFQTRFRGFRIVDVTAFGCLAALVLSVYGFKAHAGVENARISDIDGRIADAQRRIRILDTDLAHLEQPARLEQLSTQYLGLAPISAKHETSPESLMEIARQTSASETAPKSGAAPKTNTTLKADTTPKIAKPAPAGAPTLGASVQ